MAAEIEAAKALKIALGMDADDAQLYHDMIEGETSLYEMIDAVFSNIQEDQEIIDGITKRESDLYERKERLKKRIGYRKAKIEQALLIFDDRIERPEATFYLTQRAAKAVVSEESEVPSRFWKAVPQLDKDELLKALIAGEAVPGACLSEAPKTLTIRRA